MANLNVDLDYLDHPKTQRLARLLGNNAELIPIRLWIYCGKFHSEAGELPGYSAQEIESICKWRGQSGKAVKALLLVKFISELPGGGYAVHQWADHQGHIEAFKTRARAAATARWDKARAASNAQASIEQCSNSATPALQINTGRAPVKKKSRPEILAEKL